MEPTFYVKITEGEIILEFEQSKNHWPILPIKTQDQETAIEHIRSIIKNNKPDNYGTLRNSKNQRAFVLRCPNRVILCESPEFGSYRDAVNAGKSFSIALAKAKFILDVTTREEFEI